MKLCKKSYLLLGLCLLSLMFSKDAYAVSLKENGRTTVSPGVIRREVSATIGGRRHIVDIIEVDLNNPYAELEVMAGAGSYTRKSTVSKMANRTNAFAAINGDFFNMSKQGAPFGPSVVAGKLQSSPLESIGLFAFGIDGNRKGHIEPFTFKGTARAQDGASYPISGLNKTDYIINHTQIPSHKDSIQLYNDFWTAASRGLRGSGEVLVSGNYRVERISLNKPLGIQTPKGKYILQVNGQAKDFIKNHVKVGDKLHLDYQIRPDRNWRFLIGGHALLVENGRPKLYTMDAASIDGKRARSAVAISKDKKRVYLIATEGRNKKSSGMRLAEWGATIAALGVDKAMNLDGGGSTTMVARSHGDFKNTVVTHPERHANERAIVNGIGVMNKAPKTSLSGVEIAGEKHLVLGEVATYSLGKAWDSNYHPMDPASIGYSLSDTTFGKDAWVYSRFLSPSVGKTNIRLSTKNGITATLPVDIQSPAALKSFKLEAKKQGNTLSLTPTGTTKSGRSIFIDPNQINWHIVGAEAAIDNESWKIPDGGIKRPAANIQAKSTGGAYIAYEATFGDKKAAYVEDMPGYKKLAMTIGKKQYTLAGAKKTMDTTPIVRNNRTLVPLRFVLESYGADVQWREEDRTAVVRYKGRTLELPAGQNSATIDGKVVQLDIGATIADNRTLIPLRFVAETLGMDVYYENSTRNIFIYEKNI